MRDARWREYPSGGEARSSHLSGRARRHGVWLVAEGPHDPGRATRVRGARVSVSVDVREREHAEGTNAERLAGGLRRSGDPARRRLALSFRNAAQLAFVGAFLATLFACGGSPRGAPSDVPTAPPSTGAGAGPDTTAEPPVAKMSGKILAFEKAKEHLRVDKVGAKDGAFEPDGIFDHVYEVDLEGPADALFVISTDDQGASNGDFAVDTLVATEALPQEVAALGGLGKHTGGLGVFEGPTLKSAPDGHLPALAPGRHTLHVHLSGKDVPKGGGFRVLARFTDGSVVAGPHLTSH